MSSDSNLILVALYSLRSEHLAGLKGLVTHLDSIFEIQKSSSIYQVEIDIPLNSIHAIKSHGKYEVLTLVVKAETDKSPEECHQLISSLNLEQAKEGRGVNVELLVYGQETRMLPSFTLPHPDLHMKPEKLQLAAEVWREYKHPILNVPLVELVKKLPKKEWGQFFSQGKSILDF